MAAAVIAPLCIGLVLSGSRTGALGTLILAAWGLLDRRLSQRTGQPVHYVQADGFF